MILSLFVSSLERVPIAPVLSDWTGCRPRSTGASISLIERVCLSIGSTHCLLWCDPLVFRASLVHLSGGHFVLSYCWSLSMELAVGSR